MNRRRRFALPTVLVAAAVGALIAYAVGGRMVGDGLLFDLALRARSLTTPAAIAMDAPVAVIAIDRASLEAEELGRLPRALFGPVWAELVEALGQAEARAVGFDLLLSFSGNALQPGYDRDFQRALFRHGDKIVLGRTARVLPAKAYQAALRFEEGAFGFLELSRDGDGVYRRIATRQAVEGGPPMRGFTAALLARAGAPPPPAMLIPAPRRHPESLPTYSLIDVWRCLRTAPEAIAVAFAGRIVLIGSVLAEEDRLLTAARYLPAPTTPGPALTQDCELRPRPASLPEGRQVPGVHLHAQGVAAALTGAHVEPVGLSPRIVIAGAGAGLGAVAGLLFVPWTALALTVLLAGLLWAGEVALIGQGLWFPAALPMAAAVTSMVLAYLVRYLVEERRRRAIQRAFGRYLAPSVVAELADNPGQLKLGGTVRPVSIMFADLSGFTRLSTTVGPERLVALTNEYLAIIADVVDESGGYVDKYIGDAVMAIWGAPVPDSGHAAAAVTAALNMKQRIEEAGAAAQARGDHAFGIKIGVYSGEAVVGNVGSSRRYNYTAVGETVNVASRMESLPGVYECTLLIGQTTAEAATDAVFCREIDRVAVKGREEPLSIHEPLALKAEAGQAERDRAASYADALAHYRARRFAEAAAIWDGLGAEDGPARVMAARAREYLERPPPEDWDGVFVMSGK